MSHKTLLQLTFVSVFLSFGFAATVASANICDEAARKASVETGVPLDVLLTITRMETGRVRHGNSPWPWTVNHAGNGSWFSSEDEARSFVFSQVKRGSNNIDIGCFQINYKWHKAAFRSLDDMFHPETNARYAADFLSRLHTEFGDWTSAVGAYHSRTPEYADVYKAKFQKLKGQFSGATSDADQTSPVADAIVTNVQKQSAGSLFVANTDTVTPFLNLGRSN